MQKNFGVKVLDDTRDERGDFPSMMIYYLDDNMEMVEVATLTFEQAETFFETGSYYVGIENLAITMKYGDLEDENV